MSNFSWKPRGSSEDRQGASYIEPSEVLYEIDLPMIFVTDEGPWKSIWYLCDKTDSLLRYLRSGTNTDIIDQLKSGSISVLQALRYPHHEIIDLDFSFQIVSSWKTNIEWIPSEFLPKQHAMLHADLEPILDIKFTGSNIKPHLLPISAIKRGVDGAYAALKKLAEAATSEEAAGEALYSSSIGRPKRSLKKLFDLPTQKLAFGSLEIAFSAPSDVQSDLYPDETRSKLEQMSNLLTNGLEWAYSYPNSKTERPSLNILEALERLSPPLEGAIEKVELRGQLIPTRKTLVLNRDISAHVRRAISQAKREDEESNYIYHGYVRELDKDNQTFTLRDSDGNDIGSFTCLEDTYEDALSAFSTGSEVAVIARSVRGKQFIEAHHIITDIQKLIESVKEP